MKGARGGTELIGKKNGVAYGVVVLHYKVVGGG